MERAKAFFLTSDMRLAKYNFLEMGHKDRATICEVIPDRLLTNILWLKNPNLIREIPLDSIIAMHSRHLFIDKDVWRRFLETVQELRKNGNIDEKDVSILLYDTNIQEVLRNYGPEDAGKVDPVFVLQSIESIKRSLDNARKQELERQQAAFEQKLSQAEQEMNDRLFSALASIKQEIKTEAEAAAKYLHSAFMIAAVILLIVLSVKTIPVLLRNWAAIEPVAWLVSIVLPIMLILLGYKFDPFQLKERFRNWLFNSIYQRKLQKSKLERIKPSLMGENKRTGGSHF